ncbi:MAG: hypothetical protein AAGI37_17155 [Planctomycetota bacterium]
MMSSSNRCALAVLTLVVCFVGPRAWSQDLQVDGNLGAGDEKLPDTGEWFEVYEIELEAGELLEVSMVSDEIDSYLMVIPPRGDSIENDDIEGESVDAHVLLVASVTGTYEIIATSSSPDEAGGYRLEANRFATKPVKKTAGSLSTEDEVSWKGGEYADRFELVIPAGERRLVSITVAAFDAYISAHGSDGRHFRADDPAAILLEAGEEGVTYTIVITSYEAKEVGDYVFDILSVHEEL